MKNLQLTKINKALVSSVIVLAGLGLGLLPNLSCAAENAITNLKQTGKAFASIAKEVSPAVVNIQTDVTDNPDNPDHDENEQYDQENIPQPFLDLFRNYMDPRMQQPRRQPIIRQGSGFIIGKDGYIVTNNHLVEKAGKITVRLMDETEYTAKVIGLDPQSDIAVIKIDAKNLPTVSLGDSDKVEVGEWVVALGNPFGLSHSLSAGVLSAKGRSSVGIADYENFLQTDAAINPGNSGGPLLDLEGKVIGINTAIFSRSGGYMGIGFAIPINMAKGIIDQLMAKGKVTRGYLGVKIQELTNDLANSFGLKERNAILVSQVEKDSPADKSGLKQGDVIIALDGKPVENIGAFRNTIASNKPGTSHKLDIIRDKKRMLLTIAVGTLDTSEAVKETKAQEPEAVNLIGISVQELTSEIASKLGVKPGVGIIVSKVKPGSIGELAGLNRGTLILEVNRNKVNNVDQFKHEFSKASKSKSILLLLQDQFGNRYVVLNLK